MKSKKPFPFRQVAIIVVIAGVALAAAFGLDVSFVCKASPSLCSSIQPAPSQRDAGL